MRSRPLPHDDNDMKLLVVRLCPFPLQEMFVITSLSSHLLTESTAFFYEV